MSHWYLIHTKIRQERHALQNLERQGFECYLPCVQAEKLQCGALAVVDEPLFPRYLFIRLGSGLEGQNWAPSVQRPGSADWSALVMSPPRWTMSWWTLSGHKSLARVACAVSLSPARRWSLPRGHLRV